jgi:integrase
MQSILKRREYWVSLKTEDRQHAIQIAPDAVRKKRGEIKRDFKQKTQHYTPVQSFTEEERLSLSREAYQSQINPEESLVLLFEISGFNSLEGFLLFREQQLTASIQELKETGGDTGYIRNMMRALSIKNGIRVDTNSQAEQDLRKVCVEGFIEARRNELAKARGVAVHSSPNPNIVDHNTGQPKGFTPISEIQARPSVDPSSLSHMVAEFLNDPNKLRTKKTKSAMQGYLNVVVEIFGDDTPPDQITEEDCIRVRDLILQLPPNFKKLAPLRGRSVDEMVRIARRKNMGQLSATGVNNYLKYLMSFLFWCYRRGKIDRVPAVFSEIKVADPVRKENKRLPFSSSQLSTIYHSSVFTEREHHTCMFWVPLIALWNGMRTNEICQLDAVDVKEVDGIWGFDVTDISAVGGDDKRIKTGSSIRLVPIHQKLVEFGLLEFRKTRKLGEKLFGDISLGSDGYYSSTFSKRSNRFLQEVGVHGPMHVFHSLRHNFKDAMRRGRVDRDIAKALGGWTRGKTDAFDIYGSGHSLEELSSELARVDYPDVDWSHLTLPKR